MKVISLLHRIARRARSVNGAGGDFTSFSMSEQTDLMEAANAAIQSCYGLLPTVYREMTEGFLLPAPRHTTIALMQNQKIVSDGTFTEAEIGRSVVIDGDENWNQVISTSSLLNPYLGPNGEHAATVYGDAVYSDRYPFDRIIGNPRYPNQGPTVLYNPSLMPINNANGASWFFQQSIGVPLYWWTQPMGNSQGNEPLLVLRVTPAPSQAYTIDVRISYWPKRLVQASYDDNDTIPLPDQFLETALVPLGLEALMSSPIWDGKGDPNVIVAAAERARQFLKLQPAQLAAPSNRVFTPFGF